MYLRRAWEEQRRGTLRAESALTNRPKLGLNPSARRVRKLGDLGGPLNNKIRC